MNQDCLEQLYELYSKELFLYAFSLCLKRNEAEDLVSDTFFKALLSLKDETINIKFWLFRVCKNLWLDSLKHKKHFTNTPIEDNKLSTDDNLIENIITNENNKTLYKAILSLPPNNKEIIILFYFCNMSLKDIAQTLGISPGAARTLLFRSRQKLKMILKEDFI